MHTWPRQAIMPVGLGVSVGSFVPAHTCVPSPAQANESPRYPISGNVSLGPALHPSVVLQVPDACSVVLDHEIPLVLGDANKEIVDHRQ
jgi:hypothetical protein